MTDERTHDQERVTSVLNGIGQGPSHNDEHKPDLHIYLRPVESQDIPEILKIYNHYINDTIYTPEMNPIGRYEIKQRISDISAAKLPFLVAIHRTMKPIRGNKIQAAARILVGFGFIDDYQDIKSMYR